MNGTTVKRAVAMAAATALLGGGAAVMATPSAEAAMRLVKVCTKTDSGGACIERQWQIQRSTGTKWLERTTGGVTYRLTSVKKPGQSWYATWKRV